MKRPFTIIELNTIEVRFKESLETNPNIHLGMRTPTLYEHDRLLSSLQNTFDNLSVVRLSGTGIKGNVILNCGKHTMDISISWRVNDEQA